MQSRHDFVISYLLQREVAVMQWSLKYRYDDYERFRNYTYTLVKFGFLGDE